MKITFYLAIMRVCNMLSFSLNLGTFSQFSGVITNMVGMITFGDVITNMVG